jgi:hypothetical protein
MRNHHGTPLSAQGLPLTSWPSKTDRNKDEAGGQDPDDKEPYGGDDDDDYDDPDDFDTGHPGQCPMQSAPPRLDYRNPVGEQIKENNMRKRVLSVSLYYPFNPLQPNSNLVALLSKSIEGLYTGKHEQLAKCSIKLYDNTAHSWGLLCVL